MANELALIDEDTDFSLMSYEDLAALTGQENEIEVSHRSVFAKMDVNVKKKVALDRDKPKELTKVPAPSFTFRDGDTPIYLTDDIELVFLSKNFVFRRWDDSEKKWAALSVMSEEFRNIDMPDSSGGFNAGRATGFMPKEVFDSLSEEEQKMQKDAKLYALFHLLVKGKGKTAEGKDVEITEWEPVKFYASKSVQDTWRSVMDGFARKKIVSAIKTVKVTEIEEEYAGEFPIGLPVFEPDLVNDNDLSVIGPFLVKAKQDKQSYNDYILAEHEKAKAVEDSKEDDAALEKRFKNAKIVDAEVEAVDTDLDDDVPF